MVRFFTLLNESLQQHFVLCKHLLFSFGALWRHSDIIGQLAIQEDSQILATPELLTFLASEITKTKTYVLINVRRNIRLKNWFALAGMLSVDLTVLYEMNGDTESLSSVNDIGLRLMSTGAFLWSAYGRCSIDLVPCVAILIIWFTKILRLVVKFWD